ncbi:hypothetical protein GNI_113010, partial [Gregarina niphandrodes]
RIEDAETCDICPLHRLTGLRDGDTYAAQFPKQEYDDCYCFYGLARSQLSDDDASASAPEEDPVANGPTTIDRPNQVNPLPKRADPTHDDDASWDASWEELVNPTVKTGSFRKMRIWRRVAELTDQWVQLVFTAGEGYSSCSIPAGARLVRTLFTGLTFAGRRWRERLYAEVDTVAQFQLERSSHQVVGIFDQRTCKEVFVGGQAGESFRIHETWLQGEEKPTHFIVHHPTYDFYAPIVHTLQFEKENLEEEKLEGGILEKEFPEEESPEEGDRRQEKNRRQERDRRQEKGQSVSSNLQVSLYPDYPLMRDFPNPVLVVSVRKCFFVTRTIVDAVPLFPYLVKDGLRIQIEACGDLGLTVQID